MIRTTWIDGEVIEGETFEKVCQQLWDSAHFDTSETLEEYMQEVAKRVRIQTGKPIFYSDFETFINELDRVGIITKLEISA